METNCNNILQQRKYASLQQTGVFKINWFTHLGQTYFNNKKNFNVSLCTCSRSLMHNRFLLLDANIRGRISNGNVIRYIHFRQVVNKEKYEISKSIIFHPTITNDGDAFNEKLFSLLSPNRPLSFFYLPTLILC